MRLSYPPSYIRLMTDETVDTDALLSRVRVIEDQPLPSRAEAFTQLHDELRAVLERGDAAQRHG
jgi:hypothetical protein